MPPKLTSSTLQKIHEIVDASINGRLALGDCEVGTGAVFQTVNYIYGPLHLSDEITLTNRSQGYYTNYKKLKIEVQLAEIRVAEDLRGITLFQQFNDCRPCSSMPYCGIFKAGSVLLTRQMYTGYTYRNISYRKGIPFGNCKYYFYKHLPSTELHEIHNYFCTIDLLPTQGIRSLEDFRNMYHDMEDNKKHGYPSFPDPRPSARKKTWDTIRNHIFINQALITKMDTISLAVDCAGTMKKAYEETQKNLFTDSLVRIKRLGQSIEKRIHRRLHGLEYCPKCLSYQVIMQGFNQERVYYQCHKCRHKWTRTR